MPKQRNFDQLLLITVLIMMGIGVVMIYNASAMVAIRRFNDTPYHFVKLHLCHLMLAMCLLIAAMNSPYFIWRKWSPIFLIVSIVLLCLVFIPCIGMQWGGARRWIRIAPFLRFQPSELAKIAIVLFLASFLAKKRDQMDDLRSISGPLFLLIAAFFALVVAQPDLGTAALIVVVGMTLLFVAGMPLHYLLLPGLMFVCCIGLLIWVAPYRLNRVFTHINPWCDPKGKGYQLTCSLINIGSGGKMGRGLGNTVKNGVSIPEPFTDFIFAIIGGDVGLIGTCLIVVLFFLVAWRGFRISSNCKDLFGCYLTAGITCMICYQAFINMGVVTGLLPTKGITLPFISYGGSSLLFNALGIGILLNVSQYA